MQNPNIYQPNFKTVHVQDCKNDQLFQISKLLYEGQNSNNNLLQNIELYDPGQGDRVLRKLALEKQMDFMVMKLTGIYNRHVPQPNDYYLNLRSYKQTDFKYGLNLKSRSIYNFHSNENENQWSNNEFQIIDSTFFNQDGSVQTPKQLRIATLARLRGGSFKDEIFAYLNYQLSMFMLYYILYQMYGTHAFQPQKPQFDFGPDLSMNGSQRSHRNGSSPSNYRSSRNPSSTSTRLQARNQSIYGYLEFFDGHIVEYRQGNSDHQIAKHGGDWVNKDLLDLNQGAYPKVDPKYPGSHIRFKTNTNNLNRVFESWNQFSKKDGLEVYQTSALTQGNPATVFYDPETRLAMACQKVDSNGKIVLVLTNAYRLTEIQEQLIKK